MTPYFKEKIFGSYLLCGGEISCTLLISNTILLHTNYNFKKRKRKKPPLTDYEKWWLSEPELDFIQCWVQWCTGKCLKTKPGWGKGLSVAFADVSGINSIVHFKLPTWSQPAHKIPQNLTSNYELTLADHWDSSLTSQQGAFMWVPNCTRIHRGLGCHAWCWTYFKQLNSLGKSRCHES